MNLNTANWEDIIAEFERQAAESTITPEENDLAKAVLLTMIKEHLNGDQFATVLAWLSTLYSLHTQQEGKENGL